jgi:hypothetical protein
VEAYLNGIDDPTSARREIFDALADEPISLRARPCEPNRQHCCRTALSKLPM